jgi:acetyl/propionyl-CoA carboxylase alpha subunit
VTTALHPPTRLPHPQHTPNASARSSQVDALAPHVREATQAVCLGNKPRSYTDATKLLQVQECKGLL